MTYSQFDLAQRMLKDLGLVAAEETPSASDMAWANETITSEVATLAALDLPIWNGSDMSIPAEYFTLLSLRIGLAIAPSYGIMSQAEAIVAKDAAERNLTILASPRGSVPALLRGNDSTRGRWDYANGNYRTW